MGAFTSAQIDRYSEETLDKFRYEVQKFNSRFKENNTPTRVYFSEVSFNEVENENLNEMLNRLPTTLELEDDQIDQLIIAGRILLRQEPSYMRFIEKNGGRMVEGAITSNDICKYFSLRECAP